jgi:hypothetical protein
VRSTRPFNTISSAWELERPTPNFDAALKALTDGIAQRDTAMLSFLGVYLD